MQIETMVEVGGLVLVGAAMLRATIAVVLFAGHNIQFGHRNRQQIKQFRAMAADHVRRLNAVRKQHQCAWEGKRQFQIVRRIYENAKGDICSFYLAPLDGVPMPPYRPGQFLTIHLPIPGVTRCYSLSEYPAERQMLYRITVKKHLPPPHAAAGTPPGLSSCYLHDQLNEGDVVEAVAPAGSFCLDQASSCPVVLIAGGVGLTPLLSMLNWLIATRSQRPIWIFYGVRNRSEHAFYDHLKSMHRDRPNIRLIVFYSCPTPDCWKGIDYDVEGHISIDVMKELLIERNYEFYICGPRPLMETVTSGLMQWGVPQADIKLEGFGSAGAPPLGRLRSPRVEPSTAPLKKPSQKRQIRFVRSKKTVAWTERDGTLLELAEACGVRALCSCRSGQCGTCKVLLKHGTVDYIQEPLMRPEAGFCLLCVTQPRTDLVLDL